MRTPFAGYLQTRSRSHRIKKRSAVSHRQPSERSWVSDDYPFPPAGEVANPDLLFVVVRFIARSPILKILQILKILLQTIFPNPSKITVNHKNHKNPGQNPSSDNFQTSKLPNFQTSPTNNLSRCLQFSPQHRRFASRTHMPFQADATRQRLTIPIERDIFYLVVVDDVGLSSCIRIGIELLFARRACARQSLLR